MLTTRNSLLFLSVCVALGFSSVAFAQRGGGRGGAGGMQQPMANPALAQDREQVKTATDAATKATVAYNDALKKFDDDYMKQPEYADAQKAVTEAQKQTEDARTAVMAKLKATPDYKAAKEKETAAQKKVDQLRAAPNNPANRDAMLKATTAVMTAGEDTSKMENDAFSKDAAYTDAKKKLADASEALKAQKDKRTEAEKADANLTTLKDAKDKADTALADAQKKLHADGG